MIVCNCSVGLLENFNMLASIIEIELKLVLQKTNSIYQDCYGHTYNI